MNKKWYEDIGPQNDIVISTRVRLARNIDGFPFAGNMTDAQQKQLIDMCHDVCQRFDIAGRKLTFLSLNQMSAIDARMLTEKHLISPGFEKNDDMRALLLSEDEKISVMINEEDHIRIQCILPGLQIKQAMDIANDVDDLFDSEIGYAFSKKWGYLTHCPTNIGTGLRASVMIHLPILTKVNHMSSVINSLSSMGLTVRGVYGEGSKADGNIYQISNQLTMGMTETEAADKLESAIMAIIEQERKLRTMLYKQNTAEFENSIMRAYGTLLYARLMSRNEARSLFSDIRLGIGLGIIKGIGFPLINTLEINICPAAIVLETGKADKNERDERRAAIIQESLHKQKRGEVDV